MSTHSDQDAEKYKDLQYAFYQRRGTRLSEEETESLYPILTALKTPECRYIAPVLMGAGGEKRIYKVYDRNLNRYVAMAQAVTAETKRDQEQFLREGQLTANLTHPNIVPIYNMGIDSEGVPFFSMELVPGDSLRDIIRQLKEGNASYKSQYTLEILLGILNKTCDAVAYAHSRNVLHLDIKPDNIRVGQFGEVFLCDWGLSRVESPPIDTDEPEPGQLDGDILNDMTLTGTMKGTPGFMAPEQVSDQNKSRQTDIYALGSILYLILTHQLPVDGKNANDIVENTRKGNVIHPRKRKTRHPVSYGLAAVVMKALALKPMDRYESVQNLQQDINRFLTGHPTEAEHAGIYTRAILLAQRHRRLTFWLMAFFALLAVVMSINLTIIRREKKSSDTNFTLYKQQYTVALRLNKKLIELFSYSKNVRSFVSAIHMIPIQEEIIAQKNIAPETKQKLLFRNAQMNLVLQQFNAAAESFEQLQEPDKKSHRLLELCQQYAALKPKDKASLSDGDLAQLLTTHRTTISRDLALLIYYHDRTRNRETIPEEHIEVVGAMLARMNSVDEDRIPKLKLSKRPEGYHLDLSHTPYSSYLVDLPFIYSQNVFEPLHLYSLDISHTPVSHMQELYALKIKELRMVGVSFRPAEKIDSMLIGTGAERVILGKGEYPARIIKWLREEGVEVVEEEYER